MKSDTSTSPSAAPTTKSDLNHWTSPSAAPATKSDTWTSPTAALATISGTWTSASAAPATKSDTWTSPSVAPATQNDSPASSSSQKKLYNARSNRPHDPTSPNTAPVTQKDSLLIILVTYETSFTMRGATAVTIEPHQLLRLPRKMTLQNFRENVRKLVKRHFQWWDNPRMIREWKSPQTASQPRLIFDLITSIFLHVACRLAFKNSRSAAPAMKSDTSTSPSAAPTTKSDLNHWTSPSAAPAKKSDTWTSPTAALATISGTWTSASAAPATKSDTWTSPSVAPATQNDSPASSSSQKKLYNARSNRPHDPTSPNTAPVTQKDSLLIILVTYETSFTMRGATAVTIEPHQLLRLPRKMTLQNFRENVRKLVKRHFQCGDNPRMIREWKSPQTASQPRLIFDLITSIFLHVACRLAFKNSRSAAPAMKSDTSTSPSAAPTTKSDLNHWTSPSAAPAKKSDTWTSPTAALATISGTWTSASAAPATKSDTWTSPSVAPATQNDSPASSSSQKKLYNARGNRPHDPTSPNTAPVTQKDSLLIILVTYETSFTMRGATAVTIEPHQLLRLPRKMTLQNFRENVRKLVKRHFQCGDNPRMIREWKSPQTASQPRLIFDLITSIFLHVACRLAFKNSWSAAPAAKRETWTSPSAAPATKSDTRTRTSPSAAPATKSDTRTSPTAAPATKSDTWTQSSAATATKSDSTWHYSYLTLL